MFSTSAEPGAFEPIPRETYGPLPTSPLVRVGCFRLYWRWRSRCRGGRPKVTEEIRELIQRLAEENPDWGAPKIHGEIQKLGLAVSERTVARYLRRIRRRGDPAKPWLTFLRNHREVTVALDFFTVPTVTFKMLYSFFVIEHQRRKILHFNVTRHPSAEWIVQQLREAFAEAGPYRYVILDRDKKFDASVITFLQATGLTAKRTSVQAPWQNGTAERWVGSCRREMLVQIIALNERHLLRLHTINSRAVGQPDVPSPLLRFCSRSFEECAGDQFGIWEAGDRFEIPSAMALGRSSNVRWELSFFSP